MSNEKDKYKDSVFLPKTDFPMRGELPKREPEILKKWQDMDLYAQMRQAAKGRKPWVLHDGLPIEWKIEEKYRDSGKDKDAVDILQFRDECRKFAQHWVDVQSAQFQRLGVSGDWENPYLTMTNRAESIIAREIHKFAPNGGLYRGAKPVLWSIVEKTALAEAEVEYKEHKSITVWVKFPVKQSPVKALDGASIVIWTTTPWTLPSNRALAYGDNVEYSVYKVKAVGEGSKARPGETLALAVSLAEGVKAQAKIEEWELLSRSGP